MYRVRFAIVTAVLIGVLSLSSVAQAASFANPAFQQQWNTGEAVTANFWGPLSTAKDGQQEPYKEATGGQRLVQYFDKGRMELTNSAVTSGLLATELVKGQIQVGDSSFQAKAAPAIAIAGDPSTTGATYAALGTTAAALLQPAQAKIGITSFDTIQDDGSIRSVAISPSAATNISVFDDVTKHNVPSAFAQYRDKAGLLTIGYAITEPFNTSVNIAGQKRFVMAQVFERRVLTYTASNDPAFQVEMGNIGQHYFTWRYTGGTATTPPPAATTTSPTGGTQTINVASAVAFRYPSTWKYDPSSATATSTALDGPTPTLKLFVQNFDQTDPIGTVIATQTQLAHKIAAGGITSEATTDQQIGGEPGKVYTFSGARADKSPVSGLIAVVFHKGREYDFSFLANTAPLPNMDDITGILATVTFQS